VLDNAFLLRTLPGNVNISVNIEYFDILTPSTSCVRHDNPPEPPLPISPTLDGAPLVDSLVLANDGSKPIEVGWTFDNGDTPVVTQVNLLKDSQAVRAFYTTGTHAFMDPRDLEGGVPYRVQIVTSRGFFPNAASGDFFTRKFPMSVAVYQSGFFSISKP
jgi:hypothetical protein